MSGPNGNGKRPGKALVPAKSVRTASHLRRQAKFLAEFSETGNVKLACEKAKIARRTHYTWMEHDPTYPERFEDAQRQAVEVLEAEAFRRGVEGVDEPAGWYKGEAGGVVRRYSDTLLIFLLKGAAPEKYAERARLEHTGKGGGPIQSEAAVILYVPQNGRDG